MITFIIWARCLAAMLVTNSHYTGIYPTDLLANGGLIGDVLFFAVSGYCLTNVQAGFFRWYAKRLRRILPAMFVITAVYLLLSQYHIDTYASGTENTLIYKACASLGVTYPTWLSWFVYPTGYHFLASILMLYIPYYFIVKCEKTRKHLPQVMLGIFALSIVIYFFFYDKSTYHIDAVREPFIRFLFMESMLLGAYFKINDAKLRNQEHVLRHVLCTGVAMVLYFVSKIGFARGAFPVTLQIVNQLLIFLLLYFTMRSFAAMDGLFEKAPAWLSRAVTFVASITLEIYLVQTVLVDAVRQAGLLFPLNWLVLTAVIVLSAFVLHFTVIQLGKVISYVTERAKKEKSVR